MDKSDITYEVVSELMELDAVTGRLFWKKRSLKWFSSHRSMGSFNSKFAGKEALGKLNINGYPSGKILGFSFLAHRVVWLLSTGEWPVDQLDHINGDRSDNRMENLREVSNAENCRNQKMRKTNSSGATGVYWSKRLDKWFATIQVDGRPIYLGSFDEFKDAAQIRKLEEARNGFHPNHGRVAV